METRTDYVEELAGIARNEWEASIKAQIHHWIDAYLCPECRGSGIAVEYDPKTLERREVWCECKAPVIGRFVCSWCRGILEESEAPGQTSGICPACLEFYFGVKGETDERATIQGVGV